MAIEFIKEKKIFHLTTPNSSYIFRLNGDYILEHIYYGERLESIEGLLPYRYGFVSGAAIDSEYAGSAERISTDAVLQEYSFYGSCDLRTPAFHAEYADGSRITKMKYVSHKIYGGKPKLCGLPATYTESDTEADTLEITMRDDLTGLTLLYRYTAFNTLDVITRNVEVLNNGTDSVSINRIMSFCIDFAEHDFELIHTHGAWGRECEFERVPVLNTCTKLESNRGCRSHHRKPFFALARKNTTENSGEVYGFNLVYSGNFEAEVEVERYGAARAMMGIGAFDFSWLLEAGETFTAPEAVMVYTKNGLGEMSRIFHRLYRSRLARGAWRDKERPVLINNWEGTYFDFNEEKILNIARRAKRAGIEMLVLDDGWFGKRDSDDSSLGDWYADPQKLPNGISGLAEKINAEGMKFGLWFEPEMISPDSDLYRAHPDWCLHIKDRGRSLLREQLVLDFSRKDVRDYIFEQMSTILKSAPIAYIKWDVNRDVTESGSAQLPPQRQKETAHRYMLGLYEFLERLVTEFPSVLLEGCAGGGGRFDAGMMHYFHQYWVSDNTDAGDRMFIQHGTSLVMPPIFMGSHVSTVPNHQVGRTTALETRGLVAMCGQLGYELDITKSSDEEISEIARQIDTYKEIRETVHFGALYRLKSPFDSNYSVWEFVSEDKAQIVLFYFKLKAVAGFERTNIKLEGLCKNRVYRLSDDGRLYSGEVLMNYGINAEATEGLTNESKHFEWGDYSGRLLVFEGTDR